MDNDNNLFIEITLTNNCNCKCKYCFEGDHCNNTPIDEVEQNRQLQLIINLCKNFDSKKHKWLTFSFWGGEPFMNFDYMCKIFESTYKYNFVRYHCYSNGTLTELYRKLLLLPYINDIRDRFHILLSYDGDPHNILKRGYSKDKILETADLLLNNGIFFSFKATLAFDMVKYLPEIWKSYEELFYKYPNLNIRYVPTLDTASTLELYYDDWKKALLEILKLEYKFISKNGFPLWNWFSDGKKKSCALQNTCHIHTDGIIYRCHGSPYVNNDKVKLGDTKNTKDLNDLLSKTIDTNLMLESCLKCPSTYCAVCHITNLSDDETLLHDWVYNRPNNKIRCRYFKYFGYMSKLLNYYCICKSKYNK